MHAASFPLRRTSRNGRRRALGITLIEALIALLVLSLGMLALVQVQSQLRYNADVSKQRSEAVRIAQETMESLRAFGRLTAATGYKSYAEIAVGATTTTVTGITTNTTFTVTNTVTESTNPQYKALTVRVDWTDRNSTGQFVDVRSLISRTDPSLASQLAIPPEGSPVKNPFDRNIRIPVEATSLGDGKSGFTPPGADGFYFVFDNTNADIIEKCTGTLSESSYDAIKDGTDTVNSCDATRRGYLISGFINFDLRNNVSATSPGSTACDFYASSPIQAAVTPTGTPSLSTLLNQVLEPAAPTSSGTPSLWALASVLSGTSTIYNGSTGVSSTANLVLTFSTTLNSSNRLLEFFGTSQIILQQAGTGTVIETFTPVLSSGVGSSATGSAGGTAVLANSGTTLTINPAADLSNDSSYELVLPANTIRFRRTTGGNPTDAVAASTVGFITGPAPTATLTAPGAVAGNITLTFSEAVTAVGGTIQLVRALNGNNDQVVETFNVATGTGGGGGSLTLTGGTVLTINPGSDLIAGSSYYILVDPNTYRDAAGNNFAGISTSTTQTFTVGSVSVNANCPNDPANVENVLTATLSLTSTGHPTPAFECYSDIANSVAAGTEQTVGYFCAVYVDVNNTAGWSGSLNLLGPLGWTTSFNVCRYYDSDGDDVVPNEQHPANYTDVTSSLTDQNFLIVHHTVSCPSEVIDIGSQTGITVHYKTTQYQP